MDKIKNTQKNKKIKDNIVLFSDSNTFTSSSSYSSSSTNSSSYTDSSDEHLHQVTQHLKLSLKNKHQHLDKSTLHTLCSMSETHLVKLATKINKLVDHANIQCIGIPSYITVRKGEMSSICQILQMRSGILYSHQQHPCYF